MRQQRKDKCDELQSGLFSFIGYTPILHGLPFVHQLSSIYVLDQVLILGTLLIMLLHWCITSDGEMVSYFSSGRYSL